MAGDARQSHVGHAGDGDDEKINDETNHFEIPPAGKE